MTTIGPRVFGHPESSLVLAWDGAETAILASAFYEDSGCLLAIDEWLLSVDVRAWLAHRGLDAGSRVAGMFELSEELWARLAADPSSEPRQELANVLSRLTGEGR